MQSPLRMTFPSHVTLCEVGPRDGFQFEDTPIPTDVKLDVITALAEAGLPRIQVTSFVHPAWVPQMADAEEVVARLPERDDVTYAGLALNMKGLERAHEAGLTHVDLSIATRDAHSRSNANRTVDAAIEQAEAMVEHAHAHDLRVQMGFQTVFGYEAPGDTPLEDVVPMAERFAAMDVDSLSLADTTGMANPVMIKERVRAVQAVVGDVPIVLHLHDTRGLGLANVVAALECGITWFDTSLAGMGGCPFVPGAAGNIATEDTAYLLRELGITTGVDLDAVARVAQRIEAFLGTTFPGKIHQLVGRDNAQARI
jgi:hydroxymethylglutaryl-CoA lyase